ncbi:1-acyl-sn-glycerol-3-phosphate acyltransferase [Phaeobacter inhibens]|uniref:lysophospholipid acyltransferase family protein n=1 Tax=Phaeobacter inhibens TaxID=221822 RepID=UPI0027486509|nr:lysophospholipid acyltransferase family protein [Phaeobacter inhibens]GLO70454.1 1-acyl-sn-glycerol-3-phosphate acyltransferase [Phaeobacter inhibens]
MSTWEGGDAAAPIKITAMGWLRVVARGLVLGILVFGGLLILLLVRLVERPFCGLNRPVTPFITQWVCRNAFRVLGMRFRTKGALMTNRGAVVANHTSWLDIFALNARKRIYFVSKAEVAGWPGIGWLARATGTVFIKRDAREARKQTAVFQKRLLLGHKLLFFPEGTSTDGLRVLPFKTTLFAAFFHPELRDHISIQPVSVVFLPPKGEEPRFYGWWGDMEFGPHLLKTLAVPRQGQVVLHYHDPLQVSDFPDRKALAAACEAEVRAGHTTLRSGDVPANGQDTAIT